MTGEWELVANFGDVFGIRDRAAALGVGVVPGAGSVVVLASLVLEGFTGQRDLLKCLAGGFAFGALQDFVAVQVDLRQNIFPFLGQ